MVSGGQAAGLFKRLVWFCTRTFPLLISLALVFGTFIALQAKLPLDLSFYEVEMEQGADSVRSFGYDTPIEAYGGPVVLTLDYTAPSAGCELMVMQWESDELLRHVPLQPDRAGSAKITRRSAHNLWRGSRRRAS